jgi:pteridine reductase
MGIFELTGKVALVTGGGVRVGASIARGLARAGCDVVVHYRASAEPALAVAREVTALGRRAVAIQADLADRSAIQRLADEALGWSNGRLDVLVHSAANFDRVEPRDLSAEVWDDALALNVTAPYLLTLALAAPLRAAKGAIVAISCISAERPWKNYLPYSVSKAALSHLVRGLSFALAPDVRVNAVAPGSVLLPASYDRDTAERLARAAPLGRVGEADDVARAVVFLAENDYITGQILAVDGGRSMT